MYQHEKLQQFKGTQAKIIEELANNLKIGPRTSELNPIKSKWIQMSKFEQKSALYKKLHFFKKINLAQVPYGANRRKLVKSWILELYLVKFI